MIAKQSSRSASCRACVLDCGGKCSATTLSTAQPTTSEPALAANHMIFTKRIQKQAPSDLVKPKISPEIRLDSDRNPTDQSDLTLFKPKIKIKPKKLN